MRSLPIGFDGPVGAPDGGVRPFGRIYHDPVSLVMGGASLIGGMMSADAQEDAANTASAAQTESARLGIEEQRRQFDAVQQLLAPYVSAGTRGLAGQQDFLGLNGQGAQQGAYSAIEQSPAFQSMFQQGENAILQNASATGGLRGGNTQAALAQFRPALLNQMIEQQYSRLGGLTTVGGNAAAGVGTAGVATGNNVTTLLGQQGAAQAGGALAGGVARREGFNSIAGAVGQIASRGGFGGAPVNTGSMVGTPAGFGGGGLMDELRGYGVF